ncbi:MAG: cob(I)yrinic acid a,c-diamide adenosyltransferase [SAR324 cluster bacterium]|jgi:cob(I)alamin adenosyltransferase|nr:cob(I)yrinic acid a,c-diamide adenosyltransferase [SAR324 cluster bacterium]MEC8940205.1 cob(I)yrinic acid a,c-diamide adenosyltransferase [SAR324 cluster bacterium]MEC8981375.1 cob(I)yrinic acid a,c-diamide adenosyltransferase [SAR324 cluster bacterium]MEC9460393.1 cob(I)yrinic acid a,c-diamide adenosyltransferase [SAR324 cluster bacterium]MED5402962.1 cob(I)yrinic acid a,c-diamide adenosyltransferase [SAR324 cluster bacterium]
MVKITKVYTRTGDAGQTGLVGGKRLPKDHPRIEAYGSVDELNSVIGLALSFLAKKGASKRREKLGLILEAIQQKLFDTGSELATIPGDEYEGQIILQAENVEWLEEIIDAMNEELQPLKSFILPGGTSLNAFLHQARTVCRRAERDILKLNQIDLVNPEIIKYINRLSDFLFVAGRWVTETLGETETLWQPGKSSPDWSWK